MTTVVIPNRGRAESERLTRALINLAATGLRVHCSDATLSDSGHPTTKASGLRLRDSVSVVLFSMSAGMQQTLETNGGTYGDAATTPADHEQTGSLGARDNFVGVSPV